MIFTGPESHGSQRTAKVEHRVVFAAELATLAFLKWSDFSITFDRSDHPRHLPKPGRYPLVLAATIKEVKFNRVLIDGGSNLDLIFTKTLKELGLSVNDLHSSSSSSQGARCSPRA